MHMLLFCILFSFTSQAKIEWNAVDFKAATTYSALTATTVPYLSASKVLTSSAVTPTELGYVSGVTSAIQTQLGTKVTNPMSAGGDLIYGGASGVPTRLANGSALQTLTSAGGTDAPTWTTPKFYSDSASQIRVIYGFVAAATAGNNCTSDPCTVHQTSGGFSVAYNSTGNYTVNFSPSFSAAPVCVCSGDSSGATAGSACGVQNPSTSAAIVAIDNGARNGRFNIVCMGAK